MLTLTQAILNGLGTGAVYALIAVSFVIIFRATGVLNFAQPGLLILGTFFTSVLAVDRGLPFPLAVLLAMLVVAGAIALIVYQKVGVEVLRRAWINLDLLWVGALALTGCLAIGLSFWV